MNGSSRGILHVEDDPYIQTYLNALLSDIADISHVTTIKAARELLARRDFDLMIIDFTLPDGSGSELVAELARNNSTLPIIVFSSHEISDTIINVDRVFVKGRYKEQDLIDTVRGICS